MLKNDGNIPGFDSASSLGKAGLGRTLVELEPKEAFFRQGDQADAGCSIYRFSV
jgi:hypothetical protein